MPEPSERQEAQDARTAALRDPQPESEIPQPPEPLDTAESVQSDQEFLAPADDEVQVAAQITPAGIALTILVPWSGITSYTEGG